MANSSKTKRLIALLILIIVAAGLFYSSLMKPPKEVDYIETTGAVEATEVELIPEVSAPIEWLCCRVGDKIKKGEEAVRLDSATIEARVSEARASVRVAEESVREAKVGLEDARARLEATQHQLLSQEAEVERAKALAEEAFLNLERVEALFKSGYVPKRELEKARADYDSKKAILDAARAGKRSFEAEVRASLSGIKAALARISREEAERAEKEAGLNVLLTELDDTVIKSPVSGTVSYSAFEVGELPAPGEAVYTVFDMGEVWARVDIEETDIGKIKLGGRAEVYFGGLPGRAFEATVIEIGEEGEFATQRDVTRGRQDIKTFHVKARILKPEGLLKPGMTVTVRISGENFP